MALRRAGVRFGPDRAVALGFGELAEEPLEARRRDERQEAAGPRNDPPVRMRDASRGEHDRARADVERGAPDGELVLALQHDEQLVLVRVDVRRRVERRDLLDDRERPAGRLRRRLDEELRLAEAERLAVVTRERERVRRSGHGPRLAAVRPSPAPPSTLLRERP